MTISRVWAARNPLRVAATILVAASIGATAVWGLAKVDSTENHPAAAKSAGIWTGSVSATKVRSTKALSVGYTAKGDYWFRVDQNGNVDGHATVVYTPTTDLDGLNGLVDLAKQAESGALSLLGGQWAGVAQAINGTGTAALLGVKADTDPIVVRQGAITGRLSDGELSLRWAKNQQPGFEVTFSIALVGGQQDLTTETFPIDTPWPNSAKVTDESAGQQAIATYQPEDQTTKDGVKSSAGAYWSAHRIGNG